LEAIVSGTTEARTGVEKELTYNVVILSKTAAVP
jgi:hypothetical protein